LQAHEGENEPMVAFLCNRPSMYLTDRGWIKDDDTGCLRDPVDILNYCRKVSWFMCFRIVFYMICSTCTFAICVLWLHSKIFLFLVAYYYCVWMASRFYLLTCSESVPFIVIFLSMNAWHCSKLPLGESFLRLGGLTISNLEHVICIRCLPVWRLSEAVQLLWSCAIPD